MSECEVLSANSNAYLETPRMTGKALSMSPETAGIDGDVSKFPETLDTLWECIIPEKITLSNFVSIPNRYCHFKDASTLFFLLFWLI